MKTLSVAAALLALMASHASAQQMFGSYYAALGVQDYYNSRGAPLGNIAAVLQQDRANFHRFGRRDPQDEGDGFFSDRAMRARIPALFDAGPNEWWARQPLYVPNGPRLDADVLVFICGYGGRITYITVDHANGDGYRGC